MLHLLWIVLENGFVMSGLAEATLVPISLFSTLYEERICYLWELRGSCFILCGRPQELLQVLPYGKTSFLFFPAEGQAEEYV